MDDVSSGKILHQAASVSRSEVQINFAWRPNLLDESDNKFVEAAIHAGATIVTYNERDFVTGDLARFGYGVMSPRDFATRYL